MFPPSFSPAMPRFSSSAKKKAAEKKRLADAMGVSPTTLNPSRFESVTHAIVHRKEAQDAATLAKTRTGTTMAERIAAAKAKRAAKTKNEKAKEEGKPGSKTIAFA